MVDLTNILIFYLAIVCAPQEAVEIGIFFEHGNSDYLVREADGWENYKNGNSHIAEFKANIEMIEDKEVVNYTAVYTASSHTYDILKEFDLPVELIKQDKGIFIVHRKSTSIIVKRVKSGLNIEFENHTKDNVVIRWKLQNRRN